MNIGPVAIGGANPCRFIAEVSNNHNGDLNRAFRLIDAAAEAGADLVKFQCYTPDELVTLRGDGPAPAQWGAQGWTMRALYDKAQTPLRWFPQLVNRCASVGIPWFSSVFGMESLAVLEGLGCPAYKIARLDNEQHGLLVAAQKTGKPVLVSTDTYRDALHTCVQLFCPPGYPAVVKHLPRDFPTEGYLGLSSHCLAPELPVAAVARGCKVIEMHLQLADEPSELEYNISLTEHQFQAMVESVRATEDMLA